MFSRFIILISFLFISNQSVMGQDSGIENLRKTSKAFAHVAKIVSPAVVFIQVERSSNIRSTSFSSPLEEEFLRRFFGDQLPNFRQQNPNRKSVAQGSGFVFAESKGILSKKTYILTNNHVVKNAKRISVRFKNGDEYIAKVTGRDPKSDIAVIEITASNLPKLTMGDSSKLDVGEWVIAIGNPFGLRHTLTVGVVSAKGRTSLGISDYEDFIQTDAAINPGNSGGPLVNLDGKVVGMNTAIFSRSGGYMGVGFSIPINMVKNIAAQIIDKGHVTRGYLGVIIQSLTPKLAKSFKVKPNTGILVSQVTANSPAANAGLKSGDVIIQFKGRVVRNIGEFRNHVSMTKPGESASLHFIRNGKQKITTVKIGKLKNNIVAQTGSKTSPKANKIGIVVKNVDPILARKYGLRRNRGVVVVSVAPNSISSLAGLKPGTLILQVNQIAVNSVADFNRALATKDRGALLLIRKNNINQYLALNW